MYKVVRKKRRFKPEHSDVLQKRSSSKIILLCLLSENITTVGLEI